MIDPITTPITSLNNKRKIYQIFNIPVFARSLDYDFSNNYEYKYISKHPDKITGRKNTIDNVLSVSKAESVILDAIPAGAKPDEYREIINYKKNTEWLKRAQKKFHRFLIKGLQDIDYLQSTIKGVSYATNGNKHSDGRKYVLCLDISKFFTQVNRQRVEKNIKQYLCLDGDVAYYYSRLLTIPEKKDSNNWVLAQGFPSSPIVAFLCYKSLFDYIYTLSLRYNVKFTLYVDDITFSSGKPIPQKFIDTIFGLLKSKVYDNNLVLNYDKIHYYKPTTVKRITGVYLVNGEPRISKLKHYHLFILYSKLIQLLHNGLEDISDYFLFYNLFLKFSGNLMHLIQVEYDGDLNRTPRNNAHKMMVSFYKDTHKYFKPGIAKNSQSKYMPYSVETVSKSDLKMFNNLYLELLKTRNYLKNKYPYSKQLRKTLECS